MSTLIPMGGRVSGSFSSTAAMAVLLLMGFLLSAIHGHAASPDPRTVKIIDFSSYGECGDLVHPALSHDGKSLSVMFGQYNGSSIGWQSCSPKVRLSYPAGFRFRLVAVTMRGHAKLDDRVEAVIHTSYHASSGLRIHLYRESATARCVIPGPLDDRFNCMDDFDERWKETIYGRCNSDTDLTIHTRLALAGHSHINLTQVFAIAWESC